MKRENSPKVVKQYLSSNENNVEKIQARMGIDLCNTGAVLCHLS